MKQRKQLFPPLLITEQEKRTPLTDNDLLRYGQSLTPYKRGIRCEMGEERNRHTKATFTLLRFHFDPFLGAKTELFSSLFTLLRFQTETDIYQLVFTRFLKNASVFLFLTTRPSTLLILAFSNCSVFGVHTTELRFCLAPFSFSSVFIIVFI